MTKDKKNKVTTASEDPWRQAVKGEDDKEEDRIP
jgi:hypothetical protein